MTAEHERTRQQVVAFCEWGIRHAPEIHYAQVRPIRFPHLARSTPLLPFATDCSGFVTLAYFYAGAPDPNGHGYNGTGWTGSLLEHGRRVGTPRPGDLIVYGDPPGHHVTVYMYSFHGAWVTCSHGQEIGPLRVLNHREDLAQPGGYQVRSYLD